MRNALVGIIVVVILAVGAFFIVNKSSGKTDTSTQNTTQNQSASKDDTQTKTTSKEDSTGSTITYGNDGFSPSTLTVKAGTTVTIKNSSSHPLQFDSDPHPAHTDNTELNVDDVTEGGSQTFTVTKTGTWGYHNHLNPGDTGTIVVQ